MSDFIVSARKYRPATFASVVGQQHITSTLKNAIERGQLAHAYLFCGPRGVGKTTCARIFAKAINCLSPNGAEACNVCESCRSFNEGRSLNIHELDAASNNSVEDIRTLIEQVRIIPQVGRYSVFIIDEVHMLSAAAFNAFLKTLEEPPAHAIFILATTEKHKIIPTILSRCQIYDFNRIRVEDAVGYLQYIASREGIAADEESLNLIAQKADGGMRDALSMFDKAVSFCGTTLDYRSVARTLNVLDYDTYFDMTDLLLRGDYAAALIAFDGVLSKGFSGQTFMSGLNRHMRDLLMAKQADTLRLLEMTGTLLERYRTQAEACDVEFLFATISILTELDGKIRQSSNGRLLVELGLMKIARLGQKKKEPLNDEGSYPLPELTPRPAAAGAAANGMQAAATNGAAGTAVPPAAKNAIPTAATGAPTAVARPADATTTAATAATGPAGIAMASAKPADATTAATAAGTAAAARPAASVPSASATPSASPAADSRIGSAETATGGGRMPAAESDAERLPIRDASAGHAAAGQALSGQACPESRPVSDAPRSGTPTHRPSTLGTSLSAMLAQTEEAPRTATAAARIETAAPTASVTIDPASEAKIERARETILARIRERRPRFEQAFEQMEVHGNRIAVAVPTRELHDEIQRNRTALLLAIARMAGIEGTLELDVAINEAIRAARPIKLEDRIRYLTEKNPLLTELRQTLDMEVE